MAGQVAVDSLQTVAKAGGDRRWLMLVMVWLVQTFVYVVMQGTGPLAPFIQDDLHISRAQVGLFMTAFACGATLIMLTAGWISDRFAVRWLLCIGTGFTGILMIAASRAGSYWQVLAVMFLTGLGAGIAGPASTKAVMVWFDGRTRGTAMGIKQTGSSLGGAIGGAVLPPLAIAVGWRDSLALAGLGTAAVGLVTYLVYREHPAAPAAAATVLRGGLRSLLAKRDLRLTLLAGTCLCVVQLSMMAYLVLYLKEAAGVAVAAAGILLAVAQISGVSARIFMGVCSDRLLAGRRKGLLVLCAVGSLVSTTVIALAGQALPYWVLIGVLVLFGATASGWTGMYITLAAELAGKEMVGLASAIALAAANIGAIFGPPVFGLIVDLTHSYSLGWSFLSLAAALAAGLAWSVNESRGRR